jgi:Flp pilus assembly protein CpaB
MRQITMFGTAFAIAVLAVLAAGLLMARAPESAQTAPSPLDIMQMMIDAKDLPVQQYDAI